MITIHLSKIGVLDGYDNPAIIACYHNMNKYTDIPIMIADHFRGGQCGQRAEHIPR